MIELISILFLIGTVGALEIGNIGIGQAIIQSSIALAVLYIKTILHLTRINKRKEWWTMLDKWQNMLEDLKKISRGPAILEWHKKTLRKMKGGLREC